MTRFNTPGARAHAASPVKTAATPTGATYEGHPGYARDAKSELFLLALANFGSGTFYEPGKARDERMAALVRQIAPGDLPWLTGFAGWLRETANMRRAPVAIAAEAVAGCLQAGVPGSRAMIPAVLQRADEPGELVAYWMSFYGRKLPLPLKRGVADAVAKLYTEYALMKYDTASHGLRFGDVIELTHPAPTGPAQSELFGHALDRRHNRDTPPGALLGMCRANITLRSAAAEEPAVLLDPAALAAAGMTWEDVLSLAGGRLGKKDLWESVIPSMGYMALLRNLRNFDEAGVSDESAARISAKLADPTEVARSRQFPLRFLSAYRAAPSVRWHWPLEQAMQHSLRNIPELPGSTLILVDTSGSMRDPLSGRSELKRWDAAAMFGIALAQRCEKADIVSFSSTTKAFHLGRSESLARALERFSREYFLGAGTLTGIALRDRYAGHRRVVILTDEQSHYDGAEVTDAIPGHTALYTWNLAGYQFGQAPSGGGNRHTFAGLTDAAFRVVPFLERGDDAAWPWETEA